MGTPVAEILRLGGATDVVGAVLGGPSGGVLPAEKFDRAIGPGAIDEAGAVLGAGGIVVIGPEFSVADVVAIQAAYNASESCGKCTPCREGGERLSDALTRLRDGDDATGALRDIDELLTVMRAASLCGLGQMAPNPVTSALQDFPEALGVVGGNP
jgi:NADH:ubiquinone oxidoreductase subunit F (NADH-binding)